MAMRAMMMMMIHAVVTHAFTEELSVEFDKVVEMMMMMMMMMTVMMTLVLVMQALWGESLYGRWEKLKDGATFKLLVLDEAA